MLNKTDRLTAVCFIFRINKTEIQSANPFTMEIR